MKRLKPITALLVAAPLAFGACRHDPTAPKGPDRDQDFAQAELTGNIRVSVQISGLEVDKLGLAKAGLSVALDGGAPQSIAPGQAYLFSRIPIGEHQIELRNVGKQCHVPGSASRLVSVRPEETVSVVFFVHCGDEPIS